MRTVLCVIGTRPEAIKMAPVVRALAGRAGQFRPVVCVTGQHRELVDGALADFALRPDHDLDLMAPDQTLAGLTAALLPPLDALIRRERPDWVLAQGDTTSVMAAALAAFYNGARFGHVEAGLRTGDLRRPFPEELNRSIADKVADLLFAPTDRARRALRAEGVPEGRIVVTGNTGIDALLDVAGRPYDVGRGPLGSLPDDRRWVLVTAHRRESFGPPFGSFAARSRPRPVHSVAAGFRFGVRSPNPNVRRPAIEILGDLPGVSLVDPLPYRDMIAAMKRSVLIRPIRGRPGGEATLAGRAGPGPAGGHRTARGVEAGMARLVGRVAVVDRRRGVAAAGGPRGGSDAFAREAGRKPDPYGDSRAASRSPGPGRSPPRRRNPGRRLTGWLFPRPIATILRDDPPCRSSEDRTGLPCPISSQDEDTPS
ncbi:MAG: UDP-N-acetylglucosamine 2-epimerase (non-hydrolyzing) [Isosphaeraceae bacterium]